MANLILAKKSAHRSCTTGCKMVLLVAEIRVEPKSPGRAACMISQFWAQTGKRQNSQCPDSNKGRKTRKVWTSPVSSTPPFQQDRRTGTHSSPQRPEQSVAVTCLGVAMSKFLETGQDGPSTSGSSSANKNENKRWVKSYRN